MTRLSLLRVTSPKSENNIIHHAPHVGSTHADNFGFVCRDLVSEIYAYTLKQWRWLEFVFVVLKASENCIWKAKQQRVLLETVFQLVWVIYKGHSQLFKLELPLLKKWYPWYGLS